MMDARWGQIKREILCAAWHFIMLLLTGRCRQRFFMQRGPIYKYFFGCFPVSVTTWTGMRFWCFFLCEHFIIIPPCPEGSGSLCVNSSCTENSWFFVCYLFDVNSFICVQFYITCYRSPVPNRRCAWTVAVRYQQEIRVVIVSFPR